MEFSDENMADWTPKRQFCFAATVTSSLDFDDTGDKLLTANYNDAFEIYDAVEGRHLATIKSEKYGSEQARWVHARPHFIHSCRRLSTGLKLVDYTTNSYLASFDGHVDQIDSLEVNPTNNTAFSTSGDGVLYVWDVNNGSPVAKLKLTSRSILTAIDGTGLVFAVASWAKRKISLYDARSYKPFLTFKCSLPGIWLRVEFSNDNNHLLVVSGKGMAVFNSFSGDFVTMLKGDVHRSRMPATFSSDGGYIYSASTDETVNVWRLPKQPAAETPVWQTLPGETSVVQFSPSRMLLVTGGTGIKMWAPDE